MSKTKTDPKEDLSKAKNVVPSRIKSNAKKILIVDDEKPITTALELKLSKTGFSITTVYDGQSALDALKKQSFDMILLDLVMPDIDGYAILEHLKNSKTKTPVIVLSNLGQEVDMERVKEYGTLEYFVKSDKSITEVVEYVIKVLCK